MLKSMNNDTLGEGVQARKLVFHRVAENLYRLESSGGYYGLLKRGDKQFRRSLRPKDRKLADRRLAELREQVGGLVISSDSRLFFEDIGQRWLDSTAHTLKASTIVRRKICLKNLAPFFAGVSMRNVQALDCERWVQGRAGKVAPQTMAHELNAMRAVFDYAVDHGLILANPAKKIKRRKVVHAPMTIPTREQFRRLVDTIRESDGREFSQGMAANGADLVEFLAYSGCRLNEGISITWADVDFQKGTFTVTGGERGTKNHEYRTVPMAEALRGLLQRLHDTRRPKPTDSISFNNSARKSLQTACRRLGYPQFTHHDFRHLFATTCIEAGVDIPTVSRWLGHKDGGALAMRVYGHLRQEHSNSMIKRVSF
jgi:integrase